MEAPVTGLVWLNVPLAVVVFLAIVGIPLWLTYPVRPEHAPTMPGPGPFPGQGAAARPDQHGVGAAFGAGTGRRPPARHGRGRDPGPQAFRIGLSRRAHQAERSARSA